VKDKDLCPKNLWTTRDQGNDDQRIYEHGIYEQQMIIVCPGAGPERGNQPGYCCAGIFISVFYRVS
jgi:hypothetical protein